MEPCTVITVSDRSAAGLRTDVSGPVLAEALRAGGFEVSVVVVPDGEDSVRNALRAALAAGARLIVTTGGTGVGPRDQTPEGTAGVIDRVLPGIAEALRTEGRQHSAHAALSRGLAGVANPTPTSRGALIVNLPGSPRAAKEGAEVLLPLAGHVLDQLGGGDH
ncbi:MogA/MoaB family molybdenum cofactor biosynthesis protein [Propionicimonas sp.]|uniref:MogA/MoaB family molybdenum cofactor biosynthesis protein n=1 Tax=Propionicimonas sp. TaxID=1955623 RepID=UPI00181B3EB3|nr:MogA/MoaB family molybdenum cofactor biosynthesis protein [Propionicimonas sp.]MBU3975361.1 MogA/MoaB family molybdenum cofactor biosynthesis protein [Actinomycetota bacterium]MBA3020233.1 MogA/MoaB family molybdenum cofactor biosynthesis protein [Propionicimonas sp.]MBU3986490.1 MogA/MoaB family molybdenum cofactor biosynthesis protein [Actinomycetota bacterium]MBU4008059.1 MogA/MoaB family molybdenum cofactor biosynthesis protein [Actinomycetota bacterium]MBU4064317.1 MogA/MoaB family mol